MTKAASQYQEMQAPSDDEANSSTGTPMTPMMLQYTGIKSRHTDCLLFYRMGDFYELFFDDAEKASKALGIQLTKRGRHQGQDIPMCGVPVHSSDEYLHQLIRKGFRVAICEQTEDPAEAKKRGAKSVVQREVVRIVTPGTLTEDNLLSVSSNNFLTAITNSSGSKQDKSGVYAVASLDISTGEFVVSEVSRTDLSGEIARLAPSEVLVADANIRDDDISAISAVVVITPLPKAYFDSQAGIRDLKARLQVSELDGIGVFSRGEMAAIGALLKYIDLTQLGKQPVIKTPKRQGNNAILVIDAATRANLELVKSVHGERKGSLLDAIDRTVTGAGARELSIRLASPVRDCELINRRQDIVSYLFSHGALRSQLRQTLKRSPDIARAYSRVVLSRGGPRDLGALRDGMLTAYELYNLLISEKNLAGVPVLLELILDGLKRSDCPLARSLQEALGEDLPFSRREGGFVRNGYSRDLDEMRQLRDDSRKILIELQTKYIDQTNIKSLKIRHNNVLGYFVDVTAAHGKMLMEGPQSEFFIHRQTLANVVRFTTIELSDLQTRIHSAAEGALAIEQDIFDKLSNEILCQEEILVSLAEVMAELDVYCSLAEIASEQNYVRPIVDDSMCFEIKGGRHPVVDQALKEGNKGQFIENDCVLNSASENNTKSSGKGGRLWVLTGPNMAGKSTFLRQNALITILAQMGSFVPAQSVHIGLVDRLFSRVGASDDLARGRSTFMVEMVETAAILNQATQSSFVILDEIGRGTATFDGLSIAWATVEYLHDMIKCRGLFATHYHELTALSARLSDLANMTIQVREWNDDIVFLHKVVSGAADRSYGVQVAKLAGLPPAVTNRALEVLDILENKKNKNNRVELIDELPLFAASNSQSDQRATEKNSALRSMLDGINPDELSPRAALDFLYELKILNS